MADHYFGSIEFPTTAMEQINADNLTFRTRLYRALEAPDFQRFDAMDESSDSVEISGIWADGEHNELECILKEFRIPYNACWEGYYEIAGGTRWFRPGGSPELDVIGSAPKDGDGEHYITAREVKELMNLSPVEFKQQIVTILFDPIPPFFPK